jgi:hypothetical protein
MSPLLIYVSLYLLLLSCCNYHPSSPSSSLNLITHHHHHYDYHRYDHRSHPPIRPTLIFVLTLSLSVALRHTILVVVVGGLLCFSSLLLLFQDRPPLSLSLVLSHTIASSLQQWVIAVVHQRKAEVCQSFRSPEFFCVFRDDESLPPKQQQQQQQQSSTNYYNTFKLLLLILVRLVVG